MPWDKEKQSKAFQKHEEYVHKLAENEMPKRLLAKQHGGFCRMLCREIVELQEQVEQLEPKTSQ